MQRTLVVSSNVKEIGYDPNLSILEVMFDEGHIYHFFGVPEYLYRQLMESPSIGQFLHENIKYNYRYQRIS